MPAAQTICSGNSTTVATLSSNIPGTSFSWTAVGADVTGFTASGNGNIQAQTLINGTTSPQTVTYTITPSVNNCDGTTATYTVTVNPAPSVQFSAGNQVICSGSLTAAVTVSSTTGGASISWSATPPPGISGATTSGSTSIPVQTLVNNTTAPLDVTYVASATTSGSASCPGASSTYTVTVNPIPVATANPAATTICSGITTNIPLTSNVSGSTFSWTVSANSNITGAVDGSGNTIAQTLTSSNASPQTITYTITPTANNCPGQPITVTITVNPSAVISFSPAPQSVCSGKQTQLVTLSSLTAGATFNWTSAANGAGGVASNGTNTIPVQTLTNTTGAPILVNYSGNATFAGCTGPSVNYTITVNPLPIVKFTSPPQGCLAVPIPFTTDTVSGTNYKWTFGDGNSSPLANTSNTYSVYGPYTIKLIATTTPGCVDSTTNAISIIKTPTVSFTQSIDSGCGPLKVLFTNTSSGSNLNYTWDFGNGQTSTLQSPDTITYSGGTHNDTTYHITLTVSYFCGTILYTDSVQVHPNPVAYFGMDKNVGCSPVTVNFANHSYGLPVTYQWDYGNGQTSTAQIPMPQTYIALNNDSVYHISLTVTNHCGTFTQEDSVLVHPNTVKAFINATPVSGCAPLTVNFTNFTTGAKVFNWDFGDGNVSTAFSAAHTYVNAGTYTATMSANDGCSFASTNDIIVVNPKPVVKFIISAYSVCLGNSIAFINQSVNTSNTQWSFDDGTTSNTFNEKHIYSTAGTYQVSLIGTAAVTGCKDTAYTTVRIIGLPVAAFKPDTTEGCQPLSINFKNLSTGANPTWDFGDGNTSVDFSPLHNFSGSGAFTVKLVERNSSGCTDTTTSLINVYPKPLASFNPSSAFACHFPVTVVLFNNSTGGVGYQWGLGDGTTSALNNPTVQYNANGTYTISLITTNAFGCADTTSTIFNVYQTPVARFNIGPYTGCQPYTITFSDLSLYGSNYLWRFGDGLIAIDESPTHTYDSVGVYNVSLIVSGGGGCADTSSATNVVTVNPTPVAGFSFAMDNIPPPNDVVRFSNESTGADSYYWNFGDGYTSTDENPKHTYLSSGDFNVMLVATNKFGCPDTLYQSVEVKFKKALYVPNAFTPQNGPDEDRKFIPKGIGLKTYHIWIYDIWGNLIWESTDIDSGGSPTQAWDGTKNGVLLPQDAYVWKINAVFLDESVWPGKVYKKDQIVNTGTVTLLR